jgi:hypothetical protein
MQGLQPRESGQRQQLLCIAVYVTVVKAQLRQRPQVLEGDVASQLVFLIVILVRYGRGTLSNRMRVQLQPALMNVETAR